MFDVNLRVHAISLLTAAEAAFTMDQCYRLVTEESPPSPASLVYFAASPVFHLLANIWRQDLSRTDRQLITRPLTDRLIFSMPASFLVLARHLWASSSFVKNLAGGAFGASIWTNWCILNAYETDVALEEAESARKAIKEATEVAKQDLESIKKTLQELRGAAGEFARTTNQILGEKRTPTSEERQQAQKIFTESLNKVTEIFQCTTDNMVRYTNVLKEYKELFTNPHLSRRRGEAFFTALKEYMEVREQIELRSRETKLLFELFMGLESTPLSAIK